MSKGRARADIDSYISKFSIYQGKKGETETLDAPNCFRSGEKFYLAIFLANIIKSILINTFLLYLLQNIYYSLKFFAVRQFDKIVYICQPTWKVTKSLLVASLIIAWRIMTNHDITVFKWMDNKPVNLISSFHSRELEEIRLTQKDGSKKTFRFPKAINDYNNHMGGVDKVEFYHTIYRLNRKNVKWWHRLFFGLIDRALTNTYITYKKVSEDHITSLQFRYNVFYLWCLYSVTRGNDFFLLICLCYYFYLD